MRRLALALVPASAVMLGGCISTVASVVTAPVKIVGKGVDLMTTSQAESDEKRGRALRKREARLGKLERAYDKQMDECEDGSRRACDAARMIYAEMQQIIPTLPQEPD